MPWISPTLRQVREFVRDNIRANLPGADALVPNSVLRVLSDNMGALTHLVIQFQEWCALQLIPDTAEHEWLDRHGFIWLVNADGSTGRKMAQLATGKVTFVGEFGGIVIPRGTRLIYGTVEYETLEEIRTSGGQLPTPAPVRALDPGAIGNVAPDLSISVVGTIPNVIQVRSAGIIGGVDEETDDELRFRVLERIRNPPQGGAWHDFVKWALAVPGVTRAWVTPLEMGIGTVTVRVMFDSLRADNDGFPYEQDLEAVRDYLDEMRPVAVKDFFVAAPIKQRVNFHTDELTPNTPAVRASIEANLRKMLRERAAPGQTIYNAWKTQAAMEAPEVKSFRLMDCDRDDTMESPGHLGVLGNLILG